eukprot:3109323-Rhodomonas_salina.2
MRGGGGRYQRWQRVGRGARRASRFVPCPGPTGTATCQSVPLHQYHTLRQYQSRAAVLRQYQDAHSTGVGIQRRQIAGGGGVGG